MSDEEKSKKPETRFVGGGPSSGQQVVAGAGGSVDEIIQSLFLKSEQNTFQESTNNASAFLGYGRRIGRVPAFTPFMSPVVHEQHTVHLRVYNNGYTIDDGPLMEKDTSDSLEFFRDLSEGYVPGRIAAMYPQTKISVRVVDCTGIDYKTAFMQLSGL
ncbi:SEP domain [Trypanosoma vivax]|nr:SEP domain [Trypanosoma vivax]